jgi:hypothetical protein
LVSYNLLAMTPSIRLISKRIRWFFQTKKSGHEDEEAGILLFDRPSTNKDRLIRQMACLEDDVSVEALQRPMKIYFDLLDADLDSIPESMTNIIKTPSSPNTSPDAVKDCLYSILCTIAHALRNQDGRLFLMEMCSDLVEGKLVSGEAAVLETQGSASTSLKGDAKTAQLVFILFGLLTKLFDPELSPTPGMLQITRTASDFTPQHRHTSTWQYFEQEITTFGRDIAWNDLLARYTRFSGPIPRPRPAQQHAGPSPPELRILQSQDVSFYTLANLLNVELVWTTSICEHLEFSIKSKQLKMFRLPSYCIMLCMLEPERTFLDGLVLPIFLMRELSV